MEKIRSDAQKKADKKYNDKRITFAIGYSPNEINDGLRLKKYLSDNELSANSYIKQLIKTDLDKKGINYIE